MPQYVLLDPKQHQAIKIVAHDNFRHTADQHQVPLTVNEFGHASSSYPVVFMKDMQQGKLRSVAMLGLLQDKNLFYSEQEWLGIHVPDAIIRAPFELGPDPTQDKTLTLFIDEKSEYVSTEKGDALFEGQEPSQLLRQVQQKMTDYYQSELATQQFTEYLIKYKLLHEIDFLLAFDDGKKNRLKGMYTINEEALRELSDDTVLAFTKLNYFMPVHAMLASLNNINRLIKLHNRLNKPKITAIKMHLVNEEV
jgi:hypothetical protein